MSKQKAPASITKILTVALALDRGGNPDDRPADSLSGVRTCIHNRPTQSGRVLLRPAALKILAIHKVLSADFCLAGRELGGMDKLISSRIRIQARLADNPVEAVAIGTGLSFDYLGKLYDARGSISSWLVMVMRWGRPVTRFRPLTSYSLGLASSGIVCKTSLKVAGNTFNQAIVKYIRSTYNVLIGDSPDGGGHRFLDEEDVPGPSIVAMDARTNKKMAVGQAAYEMLGKTSDLIRVVRPLAEGVISDYEVTEEMLKAYNPYCQIITRVYVLCQKKLRTGRKRRLRLSLS